MVTRDGRCARCQTMPNDSNAIPHRLLFLLRCFYCVLNYDCQGNLPCLTPLSSFGAKTTSVFHSSDDDTSSGQLPSNVTNLSSINQETEFNILGLGIFFCVDAWNPPGSYSILRWYSFDSALPLPLLFGICIDSTEVPPENLVQDILG
jgi:hypothetical protein